MYHARYRYYALTSRNIHPNSMHSTRGQWYRVLTPGSPIFSNQLCFHAPCRGLVFHTFSSTTFVVFVLFFAHSPLLKRTKLMSSIYKKSRMYNVFFFHYERHAKRLTCVCRGAKVVLEHVGCMGCLDPTVWPKLVNLPWRTIANVVGDEVLVMPRGTTTRVKKIKLVSFSLCFFSNLYFASFCSSMSFLFSHSFLCIVFLTMARQSHIRFG
jgi:hypothetical protein